MADITVAYHADGYGPGRPAIDVKLHVRGDALWPRGWPLPTDTADDVRRRSDLIGVAYDRIASDFWQAAQEMATQRGLGSITQEGRSGGWLVFTDTDPDEGIYTEHGNRPDWLAGYRAMSEWVAEFLAAAPARVARLAQDMAMDELGSRAVALAPIRANLALNRSVAS